MPKNHSINFVSSSEAPMSEIVKPAEVTPPRKIRVDLKESKPKNPILPKYKLQIDLYRFVIFVESLDISVQIVLSCKLQNEQISQKYLCLKHKILWYLLVSW